MMIDKQVLTSLGVSSSNANKYLDDLNKAMAAHGIDSPLRVAHFLAQVTHESAYMRVVSENLNYSTQGLLRTFRKYFKTKAQAKAYARKPAKIASRVYAKRMGNGSEASGDGWRYRGRGLIQLTGKNNYRAFSAWGGEDCVANPDLVSIQYAAHSAVFSWTTNGLNALADADDLKAVTRRINGGLNGYEDRRKLLGKAKEALRRGLKGEALARTFVPLHKVVTRALNLRQTPTTNADNKVTTLYSGAEVQKIEGANGGWVRVRAIVDGYVAERYLEEV